MKKTFTMALALATCALAASPVGNPANPNLHRDVESQGQGELSVRVGYSGDFVSSRKLKLKKRDQPADVASGFDKLKRNFHGVETTVNVNDAVDVIGRLGYADHELKGSKQSNLFLKSKPGLAFGLGLRAAVYQFENTTVSAHAFYSQDHAKIDEYRDGVINGNNGLKNLKSSGAKLLDRAYSLGITASMQLESFAPYFGVQFVKNSTSAKDLNKANNALPNRLDRRNRHGVGIVGGFALVHSDRASLNVEGRFLNEQALGLTGQIRF